MGGREGAEVIIVAEMVLILLIDYTGPGNALFGAAAIGYRAWASA